MKQVRHEDEVPVLELNAGQVVAFLAIPQILRWIHGWLGDHPAFDDPRNQAPARELRPRLVRMISDESHGLMGGRQRVVELEVKINGALEFRMFILVEQSAGQRDWQPVAVSWFDAIYPDRFNPTDFHFTETHLVCPNCGDKGEAWRFKMNRTCSCGQTLNVVNVAHII